MSIEDISRKLLELKQPLQLKWRVQRAFPNKDKPTHVVMVGYSDARDIQDRLDEVVGPENWQTRYFECKAKQFCEIGIRVGHEWVWKGDNGTESQTEKLKGETSDSFKRAAVHWGINRYAYKVGEVKVMAKLYNGKPYPCDAQGQFLKGKALFETCSKLAKVEDFEAEYDNMLAEFDRNSITQEELQELFDLNKELLTDEDEVKNFTRIITRNETDKFKYVKNILSKL